MAIITQDDLFGWEEIHELGDLQRLVLALKSLPDESLMLALERDRRRGRDDYPIRAVWNSIVAGIVFEHCSIQSLRRELLRNAQLRVVCGFDVTRGEQAVPPAHATSCTTPGATSSAAAPKPAGSSPWPLADSKKTATH